MSTKTIGPLLSAKVSSAQSPAISLLDRPPPVVLPAGCISVGASNLGTITGEADGAGSGIGAVGVVSGTARHSGSPFAAAWGHARSITTGPGKSGEFTVTHPGIAVSVAKMNA